MTLKAPKGKSVRGRSLGFSLIELMVSMLVLAVVTGAVFEHINLMQKKSSSEAKKLDMAQAAREFVDQTVRDLHSAGYPKPSMYSVGDITLPNVAAGLVSVSATQILFEGDVNGDGSVYSVNIAYVPADEGGANCPCIRRSIVAKTPGSPTAQPTSPFYNEVQHVLPPEQAGEDLFAFYDQAGNPTADITQIKTVKINLSLADPRDPMSGGQVRTAMSGIAMLN